MRFPDDRKLIVVRIGNQFLIHQIVSLLHILSKYIRFKFTVEEFIWCLFNMAELITFDKVPGNICA